MVDKNTSCSFLKLGYVEGLSGSLGNFVGGFTATKVCVFPPCVDVLSMLYQAFLPCSVSLRL